jgi:hypothetical protein
MGGAGGSAPMHFCDPKFAVSPMPPSASGPLLVEVSDNMPWAYLDLTFDGPGNPMVTSFDVDQFPTGTWTWSHEIQGHAPGTLKMEFYRDANPPPGIFVAECTIEITP